MRATATAGDFEVISRGFLSFIILCSLRKFIIGVIKTEHEAGIIMRAAAQTPKKERVLPAFAMVSFGADLQISGAAMFFAAHAVVR